MRGDALFIREHFELREIIVLNLSEVPANLLREELARRELIEQGRKQSYSWECNQCGSQEYSMCVSEDDVNNLGCGRCGGDEWHKALTR